MYASSFEKANFIVKFLKLHIFTHLTPFFLGVAVVIFGGEMFSSSDTSGV